MDHSNTLCKLLLSPLYYKMQLCMYALSGIKSTSKGVVIDIVRVSGNAVIIIALPLFRETSVVLH